MFSLATEVFSISLSHICIGYGLTYFAITQNTMAYILGFQSSSHKSLIDGILNALLPVGAAMGGIISSKLVHAFTFRITFMIQDVLGIFSAILACWANIYALAIARSLYGIVIGVNCAIAIQYIHQIVPVKYGGLFGGAPQSLLLLGLTLGFAVQWVCLQYDPILYDKTQAYGILGFNNWRIVMLGPTLPYILRFLSFVLVYRSKLPYEYIKEGKENEAQQALLANFVSIDDQGNEDLYVQLKIKELKKQCRKEKKKLTLIGLFARKHRFHVIVCCIFAFFQQWAGINAVNFYAGTILEKLTNENYTVINLANCLNGLLSMASTIFSSFQINKHGRRPMLLFGNGICAISLLIFTALLIFTVNKEVSLGLMIASLVVLFTYIVAYSMSLGPVFWVYISEVLPAKGIDLVNFVNWMSCAALAQIFPIVAEKLQVYYNFAFFAVICILCELLIYFFVIETKGLTRHEIHLIAYQQSKTFDSNSLNAG